MASTTELPTRSAGGGRPSAVEAEVSVAQIAPYSSLSDQLQNVYDNLTKDEVFQDGIRITDSASFFNYMCSPAASVMVPPADQDLTYPMSSYYISSSHNTYLSGNQLYGHVSTEAYTNVLKRGCRCLEIDVWDGEDIDTSASGSDDETLSSGRGRSNSKPSRWSKMKARAANIRGSSPKASKLMPNSADADHQPTSEPNRLSPSLSPSQYKAEPRVFHGYTLTQSITFRSVCQAIRESAFVASELPLIVSLEVHAGLDQQQTMVEIMREVWKGLLVDMTSASEDHIHSLPSPESLKSKILIKVKWTANPHAVESNNPLEHISTDTTDGSTVGSAEHTSPAKQKSSKILHALSELGVYTRAYTFKHWDQPEASMPTHVFSLSEGKMHDMHADPKAGPSLFQHNRNFLLRVFPRGTRVRSSNVDPTFHWRQGAQMVALNWQKIDKGMMLNEGMFAGSLGWVLKPDGYRNTTEQNNTTDHRTMPEHGLLELKIQLLSAQNLPLPVERDANHRDKMKPYVKAQLHVDTHGPPGHGKPGSESSLKGESDAYGEDEKEEKKYRRRSRTTRGDSPNFEGESLSWSTVSDSVDQLSFIRELLPRNALIRIGGEDQTGSMIWFRLQRGLCPPGNPA